jgi:ABC-2 type transport system permease protein
MRNVLTLLRRELGSYFASILGYIVIMLFLVVMGIYFLLIVDGLLRHGPTQITVMQGIFSQFWLPSLIVIPAITMRLLAEEKRAGTLEPLMTTPVTEAEVVVAKWLGACMLYTLMWAGTGVYILILEHFAGATAQLDLGPIAAGYVGVLLVGQFYIAVGVFASSLTKNQVAAALMSFAVIFTLLLAAYIAASLFRASEYDTVTSLLVIDQIRDFTRGIVDPRPVVLYVSGTAFVLFVTTRVVESRKWR